ncbi:MAG: hypothetical protein GAK35_01262 [Herbaspirillum frisingense]|uniref:Uncharacterized protein n=1 Tax=Herbaspirillum frisingense TaxID=92645 RepID=A0A7V8JUW6_9BURK|nr:MAG: hypothetical protein GAK35_01262 [Herbaspirillum frisingense]
MTKDNGNWLSAEQAVLPDGTQRDNLPLIKKKLPMFSPAQAVDATDAAASAKDGAAPSGPADHD